jgi:hypothetical protein
MPRLPLPRRWRSQDSRDQSLGDDGLTIEAERSRRLLAELGLQIVGGFMLIAALLYWLVSSLFGGGILVPTSAGGVLGSATTPLYYSWSSESVREATLAGNSVREDAYRSAVVDLKLNKSQDLAIGVFPQKFIWLSDGITTASYTNTDQQNGVGWQLVNNVCAHQAAVPASDLAIPTPADIEAAHPKLISSQGTVFGQQAWVLSFTPTPTILRKAFWIAFFDAVTSTTPSARDWVLSTSELAAIDSAHIKLVYAYAYVTRSQPRYLRQIEMKFYTDVNKTSGYRFLIKLYPNQGEPLTSTSFGTPNCGGTRVGSSTVPSLTPQQPKAPTKK